jgi:hypothetical protein
VSRITGFSRSTVSRHRQHARPIEARFGVIAGEGGSSGALDPLGEAISLFRRASTARERLRAAEAVRAATALAMRRLKGTDDPELLERLDQNVVVAAELFRSLDGFDAQLRALAGHREAIKMRLEAVRTEGEIEVPGDVVTITDLDGGNPVELSRDERTYRIPLAAYFAGTPKRFHDATRYSVGRTVSLSFEPGGGREEIEVRDAAGVLVWSDEVPIRG